MALVFDIVDLERETQAAVFWRTIEISCSTTLKFAVSNRQPLRFGLRFRPCGTR